MSIPNREELLIEANKKLNSKSDTVKHLLHHMSIEDYVILLYNECTPSQYGILFEEKLISQLKEYTYTNKIPKKYECGDLYLRYPAGHVGFGYSYYVSEKTKFEVKFSYVNKKHSFNIRNIRLYNDFDYIILGVCNPHENFELTYYCIKKEDIEDIGLTPMNGTKKSNKNNENICYGTTISLNGYKEFKLCNSNVLEGNTHNDLLKFMSNKQIEIRENFMKKVSVELPNFTVELQNEYNPDSEIFLRNKELYKMVA